MNLGKLEIDEEHKQILEKFYSWCGQMKQIQDIKGIQDSETKKWKKLDPDKYVKSTHKMHQLTKCVYARKTGHAQSLQLKPDPNWGLGIDHDENGLLIHYNFEKTGTKQADVAQLEKCLNDNIPIGLLMNLPSNELLVLGLGKVISKHNNNFVIESFGLDDNKSKEIKKLALLEYARFHNGSEIDSIQKISWQELISKFESTEARFRKEKKASESWEKNPIGINEIIDRVNSAEWVIPDFQRYFVWSEEDVKSFMNSIFHGYYVGTLLLWDVKGKEELGVIHVKGTGSEKPLQKNKIILDGQQRVTSLNYVICAPDFSLEGEKTPSYFYINFGSFIQKANYDEIIRVSKKKIPDEICFEKLIFPLFKLKQLNDWIKRLQVYINKNNPTLTKDDIITTNEMANIIEGRLNHIYSEFRFPVVELPESISLDAVAEIFERINSTGKELDTFDLFIVRLSRYKLKLRDLWKETCDEHKKIYEYFSTSKPPIKKLNRYVLETLALSCTELKSCKRIDILNLYKTNKETIATFKQKWKKSSKYINKAITLLEDPNGFGTVSTNEIPYEPMIPTLASLLLEIDRDFRDSQRSCILKLKNWYWTSVFDTRYSSGVEGKKSLDYKEMIEWFRQDEKIPQYITDFRETFSRSLKFKNVQSQGTAQYNGVMCLLASKGAIDFEKIIKLEDFKLQKDHIFPQSKFKKNGLENSVLNVTWLTRDTNIRTKKAKLPSVYFEHIIKEKFHGDENQFKKEILGNHMISNMAYEYMKENNFEKFLTERNKTILDEVGKAVGVTPSKKTINNDFS